MHGNFDEPLNLTKKKEKASEEHKQLANFLKEVHSQLRDETQKYGAEEAWDKHITQEEKLKSYAEHMHKLATEHWAEKNGPSTANHCRIEWIRSQIKLYFTNAGCKKWDDKERYLSKNVKPCVMETNMDLEMKTESGPKLNILDVGSCYNPFKTDDTFHVTAIDIAPYSKDVTKCDFLKLKIQDTREYASDGVMLTTLPKDSFDAVIFSLFLEYIPCPKQRFLCCEKAQHLLKKGGILLIATPDSKHEGANTKVINTSWKVILAKLGLMRIQYKKLPHLHCLVFRRCFNEQAASRLINWDKIPKDKELYNSKKVFIPQDFQEKKSKACSGSQPKQYKYDSDDLVAVFKELPFEGS